MCSCWHSSLVGPCIDCIVDGKPHDDQVPSDDAAHDAAQEVVDWAGDVEGLMHAGDHVHNVAQAASSQEGDTEREGETEQTPEDVVLAVDQQGLNDNDAQGVDSGTEGAVDVEVVAEAAHPDLNSVDSRNVENVVQEMEIVQDQAENSRDAPDSEMTLKHPRDVQISGGDEAGQFQAGNVEEIVHGQEGVHDPDSQHDAPQPDEHREQFQAGNVEELTHGEGGAHDHTKPDDAPELKIQEEFKSGDVEDMVHGERHVHEGNANQEKGPYKAGDVEEIFHGGQDEHNVHDPESRHKVAKEVASAGDVNKLMRGEGGDDDDGDEVDHHRGKVPTVMDGEHILHGAGGHDHDVKQLKFVKTKEEKEAKDRFSDLHSILMHNDDEDEHADDKIRRGKKITYKDIIELGLDEDMLKGIDLTQLLTQDAEEYDDWQRERFAIKGEIPEASFWEQVGELRKRYLSFGRNDGKARDLTGEMLDPEKQEWVAGPGLDEAGEVKDRDEDDVLHELELLGNTASLRDRHKHDKKGDHIENGRDLTDL
nr:hypothetical protein BaRGS_022007 [Batillaria attramentaria]